jgi:hypothetical protein
MHVTNRHAESVGYIRVSPKYLSYKTDFSRGFLCVEGTQKVDLQATRLAAGTP